MNTKERHPDVASQRAAHVARLSSVNSPSSLAPVQARSASWIYPGNGVVDWPLTKNSQPVVVLREDCALHEVESWHLESDEQCSNETQVDSASQRAAHRATVWLVKLPSSFAPLQPLFPGRNS